MEKIGKLTEQQRNNLDKKRKQELTQSKRSVQKKRCCPSKQKSNNISTQITNVKVYIMLKILAEETRQKIKNEFRMR